MKGAIGDMAFRPAIAPAHELPDRQGVEEFIGQQQHRAGRERREIVMPFGDGIAQGAALRIPEGW